MMRIAFYTKNPSAPASMFYLRALERMKEIQIVVGGDFSKFSVALFMTYENDLIDMIKIKKAYPHLLVGVIDPRGSQITNYLHNADFLIVDSIEMKDFFSALNKPIFIYQEYPDVPIVLPNHKEKEEIVIGYHGNKAHLASMFPRVTLALEPLAEKYKLRFVCVYNLAGGICKMGLPRNIAVEHVQWSEDVYEKYLAHVDIGIAPALVPVRKLNKLKGKGHNKGCFATSCDDYVIRFKMPSNAGRAVVFGLLGVPVVADFLPSFMQIIRDGENGLLAYSSGGWYRAIESLITSPTLRNSLASNLQKDLREKYSFDVQNQELLFFLKQLQANCTKGESLHFQVETDHFISFYKEVLKENALIIFRNYSRKIRIALRGR